MDETVVFSIFLLLFFLFVVLQQEMQSRFQAEINFLQSEIDQRDEMIAKLQRQLQMIGTIRPDSPIPQSSTSLNSIDYQNDPFHCQTGSSEDCINDEEYEIENNDDRNEDVYDDDEEYASNYFAVRA